MLEHATEQPLEAVGSLRFTRFSLARSESRQRGRERIHANVVHPIDTPRLLPDPLERRDSVALSALTGVRLLVAAAVIHAGVIVAFAIVGSAVGQHVVYHPPERLQVKIVDVPLSEPPKIEEPPKAIAPIVPDFAPVAPPKPPKKVQPRTVSKRAEPQAVSEVAEPVSDGPPRRIVGLNLESTVEGAGPSFAIGSSRMGETDERATDPALAQRAPSASGKAQVSKDLGKVPTQRVAAHIPTRDAQFQKPKRLRPLRAEYPTALKAQGIEGDVVVRVDIAASGQVTAVTIVRSSGHPAFDEAAKRAASSERFGAATRDGNAVPFTLSYSYHFRIED